MNKKLCLRFIVLLCLLSNAATLHASPGEKNGNDLVESKAPSISEQRLERIMGEAKKAMTGGDYRRAVQLFTKLLQYDKYSKNA